MQCTLNRKCIICGATISDDNPDGIGFSCRDAVNKAKYKLFFEDHENRCIIARMYSAFVMEWFIKCFAHKKFRSAFKKKFYPSIVSQYKEKGYLSSKQRETCLNWLYYENNNTGEKIDDGLLNLNTKRKDMVDSWFGLHLKDMYEVMDEEQIEEFKGLVNSMR